MQRLCATLLIVASAASCNDAPPAQQAATEPPRDSIQASETVKTTQQPQPGESPTAETRTRTEVGDVAPNFSLKDQTGVKRSLDDLLADGNVALVFYRSADW